MDISKASCVCNCKDTNLKAIHNCYSYLFSLSYVVFATAKILIWKQFTTAFSRFWPIRGCVCNCKDTNLKAIHNEETFAKSGRIVVFATAKILIWKQFTTYITIIFIIYSCVCNCKDTNLKAIHNPNLLLLTTFAVVFATAKILIWKQFTTVCEPVFGRYVLCLQLQRY